jgi:hypothetical protein
MTDTEPPKLSAVAGAPLSLILLPGSTAEDVGAVVRRWVTVLDGLQRDYEVLVSESTAAGLTERPARVQLLSGSEAGPGAVLRAGVAACRHRLVCHVPCDGRYDPALLKELLTQIDQVHVVTGSRRGRQRAAWLRALGAAYRWLVWLVFGVSLAPSPGWLGWRHRLEHLFYWAFFGLSFHDSACAFRLVRREVFEAIPLQSAGAFVHVELLAKGRFLGRHYLEEVLLDWQDLTEEGPLPQTVADVRLLLTHPEFVRPSRRGKRSRK